MGTDLNAPLGQDRKVRPANAKLSRFRARHMVSAVAVIGILGLSLWAAFAPSGLKQETSSDKSADVDMAGGDAAPTAVTPDAKPDKQSAQGVRRTTAMSGVGVEETLTDDGSIVRKYTPRARDGQGPLIIETNRVGQDPRMAALPNEDLLEDTSFGRLPVIGADGTRPVEQYARPWSGARGTRVAIVVGGLGLSQTGTQRAIQRLPSEVTLAFAASGNSLQRWMQEGRRSGHEILVQVPLEPFDYPQNDPGPHTLRVGAGETKNLADLHHAMGLITNYTGIMNFMGGRFLSDSDALQPVMRDIANRGLLFLDDGSSAQSLSGKVAGTLNAPHAFADVQLDSELSTEAVLRKLDELERIARRNGTAIGVASAFDESVDAITQWYDEASRRGIEIVGVSALANTAQDE
ncbi:divergent polysaccharide deacetylase family protein [Sinorhizobium sp. BG8]|uniref:divergent polysaccharide deacetylase family protein n=1 Tax=Sinorhizobium sp. BG8 TaxID=2613773 RepID=UPI00193DF248|nr:divergent polysaccharide deacetylase family protein [Sinorhizobium sp. BG8]QRM53597.1 divergent polysaccharide deacetylase family protein [Sinorhizobium sp. BG8]